jgi:hypothetical protein
MIASASFLLLASFFSDVMGGELSLAWDEVDDSRLGGYQIWFGVSPSSSEDTIDVGNQTSFTVSALTDGESYCFRVQAYSVDESLWSDFSNEVCGTVFSEIIVDNQYSTTSSTGTWYTSGAPDPWAGQSIYSNSNGSFRWLPELTFGGTYDVYAWWTYHANRSTTVPYRVIHADGTDEIIVDQRDPALGGQWNLLGTFEFDAGSGYVEVSSENGQASADAVRLLHTAPPF